MHPTERQANDWVESLEAFSFVLTCKYARYVRADMTEEADCTYIESRLELGIADCRVVLGILNLIPETLLTEFSYLEVSRYVRQVYVLVFEILAFEHTWGWGHRSLGEEKMNGRAIHASVTRFCLRSGQFPSNSIKRWC